MPVGATGPRHVSDVLVEDRHRSGSPRTARHHPTCVQLTTRSSAAAADHQPGLRRLCPGYPTAEPGDIAAAAVSWSDLLAGAHSPTPSPAPSCGSEAEGTSGSLVDGAKHGRHPSSRSDARHRTLEERRPAPASRGGRPAGAHGEAATKPQRLLMAWPFCSAVSGASGARAYRSCTGASGSSCSGRPLTTTGGARPEDCSVEETRGRTSRDGSELLRADPCCRAGRRSRLATMRSVSETTERMIGSKPGRHL